MADAEPTSAVESYGWQSGAANPVDAGGEPQSVDSPSAACLTAAAVVSADGGAGT